ncbi:hypothetical protein [Planobispora rosea]|uniref:hypothetical protein n=1 Tax=Planobispora rosea TaxID=35762 RepID=UPI00083A4A4D|nr:hypothetical protein [Planobispora rosea]
MDDAFDDHPKVLALLDMEGGVAAIGLWTLCFAWAHRNTRKKGKTPGLLPPTLPRRFAGVDGKEWAALLVEVGLWDEVDDGWMIHDFADYLPGKEVSEARSAAGKKGAAARWGNRQKDGNLPSTGSKRDGKPMADHGTDMAETPAETPSADGAESDSLRDGNEPSADSNLPSDSHSGDGKSIASDGSRAGARRVWAWVGEEVQDRTSVSLPHEPSPPSESESEGVLIELPTKKPKPECGSDQDPDFVAFYSAYPRKVGKPSARTAWRKAIKEKKADPKAIIKAAEDFRDDPERRRQAKRFTPHPSTWLNDERYLVEEEDEDGDVWGFSDVQEHTPQEFNYR